jgi:protein-L-isoaspartate(D-aspartate) O-methyltransferase
MFACAALVLLHGCEQSEPIAPAPPPPKPKVATKPKSTLFPAPPPVRTRPFPEEPEYRRRDREAMVEHQLRAIGVTDPRVLAAMGAVPRHLFVPAEFVESSYDDTPLPIGHGQTISAPDIVGWMSQAVAVSPGDRVLDIGTGSGYQAAVLAEMGCRVFSMELLQPLADAATKRLQELGYAGVTVRCGDGYAGWPEEAPFDAILVAAAPEEVPQALVQQLKIGGRLVLPVGPQGTAQRMVTLTKRSDGGVDREETLAVRFVPMVKPAR